MFTGLIESIGRLSERRLSGASGRLTVMPGRPLADLERGESIAVNGVCLTLEEVRDGQMVFHALEETLKRSNLGSLPLGASLNLERALRFGERLGGHLVTGHVDANAAVLGIRNVAGDIELRVALPSSLALQVVEKGSIAIDGISLTVVSLDDTAFTVHLIPVTWKDTAIGTRKPGEFVNLETDLLGKYVQRQLAGFGKASGKLNMETLSKAGW
ncbi:MAG: riboflavin synthase subunit alpha [Lentisphaerae bacterium GWF2_52_8]|nr:MAG: riboflavin synthase subunit alpha [Lentisphaerae bacterium GWF2_52_8]